MARMAQPHHSHKRRANLVDQKTDDEDIAL